MRGRDDELGCKLGLLVAVQTPGLSHDIRVWSGACGVWSGKVLVRFGFLKSNVFLNKLDCIGTQGYGGELEHTPWGWIGHYAR
jgi:hypothetical protein